MWLTAPHSDAQRSDVLRDLHVEELSVGADGVVWMLTQSDDTAVSQRLRRLRPRGPVTPLDTSLEVRKLAGGPDGVLWVINGAGEVWSLRRDLRQARHSPPGVAFAEEISVGADGTVWIISADVRFGGRVVKRLARAPNEWFALPAPASATKIAGAPDGMSWTVNSRGEVWRLHPEGGGNLAECQVNTGCHECHFALSSTIVSDVSVGPDGTVWAIGSVPGEAGAKVMWLADPWNREYKIARMEITPHRVCGGARSLATAAG